MTTRTTAAAVGKAWTEKEQRVLIAAYNAMSLADLTGRKYSKAAINRYLRGDWKPEDMPTSYADALDRSIKGNQDCDIAASIGINPLAQAALSARSRGSVEAKLMNISGAREKLGLPILAGYKPAPNFQQSLLTLIKEAE